MKSYTITELKEMGLLKNRINVGILPEQVFIIKELVKEGHYDSINSFVQEAVKHKLEKSKER